MNIKDRKLKVFAVKNKFAQFANDNNEVIDSFFGDSYYKYNCPFNQGANLLKGISTEEEKSVIGFTNLVGVSTTSPDWDSKVNDFWNDYTYSLPFGDIKNGIIDGGVIIDGGYKTSDSNNIIPNNINHYILYNLMILDDKYVCKKKEDYESERNFYNIFAIDLIDEEKTIIENSKFKEVLITKQSELYNSEDSIERMKLLITMLSTNYSVTEVYSLTKEKCIDEIDFICRKNPEEFIKKIEDKKLDIKVLAKRLIESGIIKKDGDLYYFRESGLKIGVGKDFLNYLISPANEKEISSLKDKIEIGNFNKLTKDNYLADLV